MVSACRLEFNHLRSFKCKSQKIFPDILDTLYFLCIECHRATIHFQPNPRQSMALEFYIGRRLSYDGQLCTVRFHGEVKGTKGEWLGVEWDDPIRGKHSGEHNGIRYFECTVSKP